MIAPARLYDFLLQKGVSFYTGVPDSLLKHFLKYVQDQSGSHDHIITANEGLAMGLAAGHHMATGNIPMVYLQNSGLGNIINPLTSLADREMYAIPMLIMIGWRGQPGVKDEPQHKKMGRITEDILRVLELPYYLLSDDESKTMLTLDTAINQATTHATPVALLLPPGIFESYEGIASHSKYTLQREAVIGSLLEKLNGDETVVCTTGKIGREFHELNAAAGKKITKYLLSVGAMGHANHIALGLQAKGSKTIMLDGDGAILMHLGSLATIGQHASNGFIHIVLNNGSHESVGGQPTEAFAVDLCAIASACGYARSIRITNENEWTEWLQGDMDTTQFVEVRINQSSRPDLGRPTGELINWKNDLMQAISKKK